ncbi:hypothetical protein PAXINDRAFT_19455, partial [Paxillus involutus ATCC 200175]
RIRHLKSVHEGFKTLQNLLEKESTSTTGRLYEIRNDNTKREAAHSPETANDRGDTSRCDDEVRNGSRGSNNHVPRSETRREHERERRSQGRVEKGPGVGEKGGVSKGEKDDEKVAAVSGVSLVKPTSSQEDLPGTRVDPPRPHHHSKSPSPSPTTHNLLFEQTASTSKRSTYQRRRDGHVRVETRRRRRDDDDEWSRGGVESRSRGYRETNDDDGSDVDVHRAYVVPQEPHTVSQTALDEAADTSNPNATSAGTTMPVGMSNGPPNGSSEVEGEGGKGEGNERASGIVDPSSNGENAVLDSIPPTPNLDERGPPPSMPLEGEKNGQQSSGHVDETGTHLKPPRHESRTTPPERMPYDGEGRGLVIGHRQAVGEEDEVGECEDNTETSHGVDESRSRRGEAKDDEEDREDEGRPNEGEERRTAATIANVNGQYTTTEAGDLPPESPPFPHHPSPIPPTSPIHPERPDDVDTAKSNRTAARRRADDVHDPGGQTDAPDSVPPSVRLEGEKIRRTSLCVELTDVETNDVDETSAEEAGRPPGQSKARKPPRDPVGTPDGDTRRPNGPTKPPDEEEGADGGDGEQEVESTVGHVETNEPGRVEVEGVENVETK